MTNEEAIRLRILNDRYYSATSTPEEEAERLRLLDDRLLPGEVKPDREMMRILDSITIPKGLEERISAKIDSLAKAEHLGEAAKKNTHRRKLRIIWSAAASTAVAVALGFTFLFTGQDNDHPGSDLTPEETYAQVDKALTLFANALDRGYREAYKAEMTAGTATSKALEALSKITNDTNNK